MKKYNKKNKTFSDNSITNSFYCEKCKSQYPCSTQNFGLKCEFEKNFEIKNYGKIIK